MVDECKANATASVWSCSKSSVEYVGQIITGCSLDVVRVFIRLVGFAFAFFNTTCKAYSSLHQVSKGRQLWELMSIFLVFVFKLTSRSENKHLFLQHCEWPLCTGAAREVHQKAVLLWVWPVLGQWLYRGGVSSQRLWWVPCWLAGLIFFSLMSILLWMEVTGVF